MSRPPEEPRQDNQPRSLDDEGGDCCAPLLHQADHDLEDKHDQQQNCEHLEQSGYVAQPLMRFQILIAHRGLRRGLTRSLRGAAIVLHVPIHRSDRFVSLVHVLSFRAACAAGHHRAR